MPEARYETDFTINAAKGCRDWLVVFVDETGEKEWVADCRNKDYADSIVEALNGRRALFEDAAKHSLERCAGTIKKLAEM